MYLTVGSRPDIAFVMSMLAQFTENPGLPHWEALKCVYQYLIGTKCWSLTYGTQTKSLIGYADADGASQEHQHAIMGYAFLIDGGVNLQSCLPKMVIIMCILNISTFVITCH